MYWIYLWIQMAVRSMSPDVEPDRVEQNRQTDHSRKLGAMAFWILGSRDISDPSRWRRVSSAYCLQLDSMWLGRFRELQVMSDMHRCCYCLSVIATGDSVGRSSRAPIWQESIFAHNSEDKKPKGGCLLFWVADKKNPFNLCGSEPLKCCVKSCRLACCTYWCPCVWECLCLLWEEKKVNIGKKQERCIVTGRGAKF